MVLCVPCVQGVCTITLATTLSPANGVVMLSPATNRLRDTLAEACRRAHLSVKVEAGCNLTLDHSHSRPADILVPNWSVGKPAAFDLSVTSPLNLNILLEAGLTAGAAA